MIKHVRQFIARIVDTRVSEAVIDIHRSMQHLEINNDERHKVILNCLDKLNAKVQLSGDNAHNAVLSVKDGLVNNRELIIAAVKGNSPTTSKPPVPPAPGTKKPFIGSELKNERLKSSKEWASLPEPERNYFIALVIGRYDDIELQGCFEEEFFRSFQPVGIMISHMRMRAAEYAEKEVI